MRVNATVAAANAADARELILDAALESFGKFGFEGTSIGRIAARCSVSTALVHYHFSLKDELWRQAVARGMSDILEALSFAPQDVAGLDPLAKFKAFVHRYVAYSAAHPHIFTIIVKESDAGSERFVWLQQHYLRSFYRLWTDAIESLRAAGLLRVSAPDYHVALVAVGACHHFLTSRNRVLPLYDADPDDAGLVRRHADLAVEIIVHGIIDPLRSGGSS